MQPIVVVCAADRRYALPLAVMLRSLISHLPSHRRVKAYVLAEDLDPASQSRVAASVPDRLSLQWITAPSPPFAGLPIWGRMPLITYQKLMIGEWLPPEVTKAIWLDGDLLVLADPAPLWEIDLHGRCVLAVQDQRVPFVSSRFGVAAFQELGLGAGSKYFNAGMLVVDVDRWRNLDVGGKALGYLRKYRDRVFFWDQDALNAVLAENWTEVESHWNWQPSVARLHPNGASDSFAPSILHFSGNLKPWIYGGKGWHHERYYECLDQTAWTGWRPAPSWRGDFLSWYEASGLRRLIYPAEQWATWATRRLTLRYHREDEY